MAVTLSMLAAVWTVAAWPAAGVAPETVADFDGDGIGDLAVGIPGETVNGQPAAGAVAVIYGSRGGLTTRDQLISQDSSGIKGQAGAGDIFGLSLATGDFDNDGFSDLAVGVPGETVDDLAGAGGVQVIYGSSDGLSDRDLLVTQDTAGVKSDPGTGELMGLDVAAGDFDGDGFSDLVAGVPGQAVSGKDSAGAANVLYGGDEGLTTEDEYIHQNTDGIKSGAGSNEGFGSTVEAGNFDGDGQDDLAVGVSGEEVGGKAGAGAVNVIYGGGGGLTDRDQLLHQDKNGIKSAAGAGEGFGGSLAAGNFDGDGQDDLAVGVPGESVGGAGGAGAVNVIYGGGNGLTDRDQLIHQDKDGIKSGASAGEGYGAALSAGDVDDDENADLIAGVSGEGVGSAAGAGAVSVVYGGGSGLTDSDELVYQNKKGIQGKSQSGDAFGLAVLG